MFKVWIESTYNQLYNSAVAAFPNTTRRQHIVHTIDVEQIRWTPFLGVRTLLARGHAINNENGNEYNPIILFKNVNYNPGQNAVEITAHDNGQQYQIEQPTLNNNNILLRCECPDFYWRFNYYDHVDRSLWSRVRSRYEAQWAPGSANPMEMPGMCKHLMKMAQTLHDAGILD